MTKKILSKRERLDGVRACTVRDDEVAMVPVDGSGLEVSKSDYKRALKRIESLFDSAEPDTPEGEELEKLATLVEEYEEKHFPF